MIVYTSLLAKSTQDFLEFKLDRIETKLHSFCKVIHLKLDELLCKKNEKDLIDLKL